MLLPLGDDVEKPHPPFLTIVLIALNLFVFVYTFRLTLDDPSMELLLVCFTDWGLVPQQLAEGKVTGLLTSMFLHGDFFHFLGNMIVLWAFACTLETVLGPLQFGVLYLGCSLVGGLAQCVGDWESDVPIIGASGAIAGVMGAYCLSFGAFTTIRTLVLIGKPFVMAMPTCVYVVIWIAMQWLGVLTSQPGEPGVAWLAHIGGFAAGSILMLAFKDEAKSVIYGREGNLVVVKGEPVKPEYSAEPVVEDPLEALGNCVYCGSDLMEAEVVTPTLLRCGNEACARLNILSTPLGSSLQPDEPLAIAAAD